MSNGTLRCDVIKNFSPSWFASVMGTGILAITSSFYSRYLSILKYVSYGLFYFNIVLFFILLIPWILRWIFFKKEALEDLEHPILSNFYATIAIAMLVLAADFIVIGKNMELGEIFWFIGTVFTSILYIVNGSANSPILNGNAGIVGDISKSKSLKALAKSFFTRVLTFKAFR